MSKTIILVLGLFVIYMAASGKLTRVLNVVTS